MGILSTLTESVVRGLRSGLPEAAARGTAEAPTILAEALEKPIKAAVRAKDVKTGPIPTQPKELMATKPPRLGYMEALRNGDGTPITEGLQTLKRNLASFFRADPGIPKDLQFKMREGRSHYMAAQENADLDLRDALAPITTDPKAQATLLSNYMVEADNVATALQQNLPRLPDGRSLDEAHANLAVLDQAIKRDPELAEAHANVRGLLDRLFDDMVERGYIMPDRRRTDYTPRRMLHAIAQGLATYRGQDAGSKKLGETFGRSADVKGLRETNILDLLREHVGDYYRKVSEDELLQSILDDPTINFTDKFQPGDIIPEDLAVWRPGPGMPGYGLKAPEGHFIDGLMHGMNADPTKYRGGFVLPKQVVYALEHFHEKEPSGLEGGVYAGGKAWARQMTVYNPANTILNMISDYPMALMGEPGQPSRALGIIRFTPEAIREVARGLTGRESQVFDMARRQGLTGMTFPSSVGGRPANTDFARFDPDIGPVGPKETLKDTMRRIRQGVEVVPRVAAGLEAMARTGSLDDFGRMGRSSTLPYGAGAPAATRTPGLRFLAPFIQFAGLATDRVFSLMTTKGSQGRILAGLVAVPTAAMMWNHQNDEFMKVEDSLADHERNSMHIIVPDLEDPSKPRVDRFGKPVVLRFRYWVPEEIAKMWGLGNLPTRAVRLARGRTTLKKELQQVPSGVLSSVAGQIGAIGSLISLADPNNKFTGQKEPFSDKLWNLLPNLRTAHEIQRGYENAGVGEAAKRGVEELSGARFATITRKGRAVLDADLVEAKRAVDDAKAAYRTALVRGDTSKARVARSRMDAALEELQRLSKARAKEGSSHD